MSREWKPGDVAMVDLTDGTSCAVVRSEDGRRWVIEPKSAPARKVTHARPLVVIDFEDREQVSRLADAFCHQRWDHSPGSHECDPLTFASMQAALREFANPTPPRPDEPTGLGAVVEAIYDNHFVHVGGGKWNRVGEGEHFPCEYVDIDVVRVLSAGVTA